MQSVFSIFSLFTKSEVFFNHDQLIKMQNIQQELLERGSKNARMLQLLKRDRTLHANIVQVQANILNMLEI